MEYNIIDVEKIIFGSDFSPTPTTTTTTTTEQPPDPPITTTTTTTPS